MMEKTDLKQLEIIFRGTQKILELTKHLKSATELKNHEIASDAVIFNFVSIIDAVKKLSEDIKTKIDTIKWGEFSHFEKEVADIRFSLNMDLVWEIITSRLPLLKNELENLLSK